MATTKRSKKGRAAASRAKTTARPRTAKKIQAPLKKKAAPRAVTKAKPVAKAKSVTRAVKRPAPARAAAPKRSAAKPVHNAGAENPEIATLKARFQRERNGLEKRLTEAVREIGMLRHHEMRAILFERQLGERDATIGRLQVQLSEFERRPAEPVYVREVQQTLALITPAHDLQASEPDLDEFEDDRLGDDGDLVNDEE